MVKNEMLSRRVANLQESATLALNARVKRLMVEGKPVFNLTAGELDGSTPPFIRKAVAARLELNKYTPTAGLPNLRQAIADYESRRLKLRFAADNVVVTAGAKTGLFALLQVLLNHGDEVILPTPAWVSYAHMINLADGRAIKAPLGPDNDLDPQAIIAKVSIRTKAIIINSPHNPTGAVFSKAALTKLAKALRGKQIMVISDDIYATLTYDREFVSSAEAGLAPKQLIVVSGFSKSQMLTGWRIGYVVAPEPITAALNSFLSHAVGNAPLPSQLAAEAALTKGNRPSMLKTLQARRALVERELKKINKIEFTSPNGAFYFWLDVRKLTTDSTVWCERLLEQTGVALVPGEAFFAPGFVRLSFAAGSQVLKQAMKQLRQFVEATDA